MPDIQVRSSDELQTGVSLQPADFHNLVNNAAIQSGAIGDKNAVSTLDSADELLIKQSSSGALRKVKWSDVASEVSADFSLAANSVDEGKSDFYESWDTPDTAKSSLVGDGYLPVTKLASAEHPAIDVMAYGALGDNTGTVVAEWLTGGAKSRGYATLSAIQADYPWVDSLFDTIDFAACQKALDVAWQKIRATYGKLEDPTTGGLKAQSGTDGESDKTSVARSVTVFFPAGFYKINKTLVVPPKCQVRGSGSRSTVLRYTGDRFSHAGVRKTSDYTDSVTVGGTTHQQARELDGRKWKYYCDKKDFKVPARTGGMHAVALVRDELKYTTATVTAGLYHAVPTVTAGAALSGGATFLVNKSGGYSNATSTIDYDGGTSASAGTFYSVGGNVYTSTNALGTSGTLTGGTLAVTYNYFELGAADDEKFYASQTLTVSAISQRIYPYTRVKFPNGVFMVTANASSGATSLTGYVESGSVADDDSGELDVYSMGYNPTGSEQAGDENLASSKDRVRDAGGDFIGIQFNGQAWDDTIGLWLPGYRHENNQYSDLTFSGHGSFNAGSDITGAPKNSGKGMYGLVLSNGSLSQGRSLGTDLTVTGNTFDACTIGLLVIGNSEGVIFSENHLRHNRFGVRLNGLHHGVSNNRFDNWSESGTSADHIPHRLGETAVYLRYPSGCIVSGNSVEHCQRAFELFGTTNVTINGNAVTVPDPSGRTGTDHDYTQSDGFVVHATAVSYNYAEDGDGDAYRPNAGLLVTGNSWMYNDYTPSTYSPLYVDELSTNRVYGTAYGNGSWPTNASIETLKTGSSSNPNHSVHFHVDEAGLNKVHTVFNGEGESSNREYGRLDISDCYGVARGTFTNSAGHYVVLLPNPKLNDSPTNPVLPGNEFYLSLYANLPSGSSTFKLKSGTTISELSKEAGTSKLRVTTSTMHGLAVGDQLVLQDVSNTGESNNTFNKTHTVGSVNSSSQFTVNTVVNGTINASANSGVYGAVTFKDKLVSNKNLSSGGESILDELTLYNGSAARAVKAFPRIVLDNKPNESGQWVVIE